MNRRYTFERYIGILDYIREKMPDAVITSDIIVGFPGETEEEFEDTLRALRRARFDMIFSFIYSPRKGTPAAELDCQIDPKEQSRRYEMLLSVQNAISQDSNRQLEGKKLRVLCDGPSKNREDVYSGRTEGGKIVFFNGVPEQIGEFVRVEVERGDTFALYGNVIENDGKENE
jgi:tRNA-2-methylthio-N6-dimethylallyladenosine synthase